MKMWYRGLRLVAILALALTFVVQRAPTQAQAAFGDPAFQRTWERTDKPVADGRANRSWYWGPTPGASTMEDYKNAPGGKRLVQYFDKTRMEINNPNGDKTSPFYVTNGLLATELMTGRMQMGDADFTQSCAANIPLASDNDDANAPTYTTFGGLMNAAKSNRVGQKATATVDKAGNVGTDASKAAVPGVDLTYYEPITQRNVPKIFWDFLNAQGPIYVNGQYTTGQLNNPWFFASGLPTTEAYWAKVKIGGQQLDVLIQGYERRVLTYIPAYNGSPFNVQMGNVGLHYYDWRYKGVGCAAPPVPPATQPPAATPVPTAPSGSDCSGAPDPVHASIDQRCGPVGTVFHINITGFTPNEAISFWITDPQGNVLGTPRPIPQGTHNGALSDEFDSGAFFQGVPEAQVLGIWAITYQGAQSSNQSVVWFKITPKSNNPPPTQVPPPPPSGCDTSGSRNATVNPTTGPRGTVFQITISGFRPGENAGYWLTDPQSAVYGTTSQLIIPSSGGGTINVNSSALPVTGRWALTVQGTSSGNVAVGVFCVSQ